MMCDNNEMKVFGEFPLEKDDAEFVLTNVKYIEEAINSIEKNVKWDREIDSHKKFIKLFAKIYGELLTEVIIPIENKCPNLKRS